MKISAFKVNETINTARPAFYLFGLGPNFAGSGLYCPNCGRVATLFKLIQR
jgi:hypothetical protein